MKSFLTRYELKKRGLIHIYYGEGKGKTSAALGLALRALGRGFSVAILQFLKNSNRYGELWFFENRLFSEKLLLRRLGSGCRHPRKKICDACADCHINPHHPPPEEVLSARKGLLLAESVLSSQNYQMVVLDEILYALSFNLLREDEVLRTIQKRDEKVELVLTGRGHFYSLFSIADYITEMHNIKHHYTRIKVSVESLDY
ncbi:MAG: cob(I)yrinic acid a,c-diamide adenosyltransferase [Planctomycetota bacterium]|nr:cob(I)yrinic acid a,c-diamide adenosyltransferase [Planctomycetota bacterium]